MYHIPLIYLNTNPVPAQLSIVNCQLGKKPADPGQPALLYTISLSQELQDRLGPDVGIGQHGRPGLDEDLFLVNSIISLAMSTSLIRDAACRHTQVGNGVL
jgi:hypothetical protein